MLRLRSPFKVNYLTTRLKNGLNCAQPVVGFRLQLARRKQICESRYADEGECELHREVSHESEKRSEASPSL